MSRLGPHPGENYLRERGINPDLAKAFGIEFLEPAATKALVNWWAPGTAFWYHDLNGRRIADYARVRIHDAKNENAPKFMQPKESTLRLYFPRLPKSPWKRWAKDTSQRLTITEGEAKALALCCAGVPTIGISGVDCWTQNGEPLADLGLIEWAGREVHLVPDHGFTSNDRVKRAFLGLADHLAGPA